MTDENEVLFSELELSEPILKALGKIGYEKPSPIQAATIPYVLAGEDVLGQAQTGTGKTAAFALPLLSNIDVNSKDTQVLVIAPTRELAIQIAEACEDYAQFIRGINIQCVYGGQDYRGQIQGLRKGAQVVIGTPGRVMDHMRKGTLKIDNLHCLVLDEADEMLRMGFIDDVEWIMSEMHDDAQTALFSATMPKQIDKIAKKYLTNPKVVQVSSSVKTAETVEQCYWFVSGLRKAEALVRFIEAEETDASIVFVRTKIVTEELAQLLNERGIKTSALNGDMVQKQRERTVEQLKNGKLDVIVATDVAARGLDVKRMSHVFNYDVPFDSEAYVHRIGRTGRAGRSGKAILFIGGRDKYMLKRIERDTKNTLTEIPLPSVKQINEKRMVSFEESLNQILGASEKIKYFKDFKKFAGEFIEKAAQAEDNEYTAEDLVAALMQHMHQMKPLLVEDTQFNKSDRGARNERGGRNERGSRNERGGRGDRDRGRDRGCRNERGGRGDRERGPRKEREHVKEQGMETYRIQVGRDHDVTPGNIVGAIANEAGMDSQNIGQISIRDGYTLVDMPPEMPSDVMNHLKKVMVQGQKLNISVDDGSQPAPSSKPRKRDPDSRDPGKRGNGKRDSGARGSSRRDSGKRDSGKKDNASSKRASRSDSSSSKPSSKKKAIKVNKDGKIRKTLAVKKD